MSIDTELKKQNRYNKILSFKLFALVSISTLFLGSGCTTVKGKNINQGAKKMLFISHRGESHDAPENTLSAFRLSWQRNTDGIELDIYMTADKKVVCIHDLHTGRVGDKKLVVAKEKYEALRQIDVGAKKNQRFKGERIPLLSEVLAEAPAGRLIYIEIKTGPEILPVLQEVIKNSPAKIEDLRIISFNNNSLKEAKKLLPDIKSYLLSGVKFDKQTACLTPSAADLLAKREKSKVDGFDLFACEKIDKAFLDELDTEIAIWTIDNIAKAKKFKVLGVDAITSNRAAYLKTHMEP